VHVRMPARTTIATAPPTPAAPAVRRLSDTVRPTEIATTARTRIHVAEIASQHLAAAVRFVRVLRDRAQAPLVLAPQHLETRPQALDPLDQGLEIAERPDLVADPLADARLDERRHDRRGGAL